MPAFGVCFCLVCPFRSLIRRCTVGKSDVNVHETATYEEKRLNFGADYETENPLTQKKAKQKMLDKEAKEAQDRGDTEALKRIE